MLIQKAAFIYMCSPDDDDILFLYELVMVPGRHVFFNVETKEEKLSNKLYSYQVN